MPKIMINGIQYSGVSDSAQNITYEDDTGLLTNVHNLKEAMDDIVYRLPNGYIGADEVNAMFEDDSI